MSNSPVKEEICRYRSWVQSQPLAKDNLGPVSVFGGVGELTREGNDLYIQMEESGVIYEKNIAESKVALVYAELAPITGCMGQDDWCSYAASRPPSWKREIKSKQLLAAFLKFKKADLVLLKHTSRLCVTYPQILGSNRKSLILSSLKGGIQDSKETLNDEPKVQNIQPPVTLESNGTIAGSAAVQNMFKSWLTLLRKPSPCQVSVGILEGPFLKTVEAENKIEITESGETSKKVCDKVLKLKNFKKDASLKLSKLSYQEKYEHVGPKLQDHKMARLQDNLKRLCLVDDLKKFKIVFISSQRYKSKPKVKDQYNISQIAAQIDDIISTELPSPTDDPDGYKVVTEYMLHGPCGNEGQYAPCTTRGYLAPCEAVWRMLSFDIHYSYLAVMKLNFHMPEQNPIPLRDSENGTDISQKDEKPSKKQQIQSRDGKVCEGEAQSKSSQLREEKAKKNIT
ncbi:hypothetical protein Tco_0316853 [Tanacetum coccineum]